MSARVPMRGTGAEQAVVAVKDRNGSGAKGLPHCADGAAVPYKPPGGASPNTVASCHDTFKLLITYTRDQKTIPPEKLTLSCIDVEMITGFLNWLESSRQNSVSTRNQRLAAISSFYTWMQSQEPALMARCQDIMESLSKRGSRPACTI